MKLWWVAMIVVVVWAVSTPVAMASDACPMGSTCESPCGVPSCALTQGAGRTALDQVISEATTLSPNHVVTVPLKVPDPPPKSPPHSA
jgi:hypothetical protein